MSDFSPLAQLLAAEVASHRHSARQSGGEVHEFGSLVAACAGQGAPLDTAWHDGTRAPTTTEWAEFEAWCAAHGLPCLVKAMLLSMPALLPALTARGYVPQYLLHVYAHDLRHLPDVPRGLDVQPAADAEAWARVAAAGFSPEAPTIDAGTLDIMRAVGHAAGERFWARTEGAAEWQATGAYTLAEGVAAFHGAATLPAARGRGLQAALLAARLHLAAAQGAQWASVSVSPGSGSERNVRRAGFRLAGASLAWQLGPGQPPAASTPPQTSAGPQSAGAAGK
ncbi:GNAT family N-acetyltransferase [Deinococcus lacus]|uniref:GNAT family N-acetyltransferase n=1 Tax=Deinococcus lacus TaxID=392561 RepID=A0ABW1Y8T6_9DEIO